MKIEQSGRDPGRTAPCSPDEQGLRERLGIPGDARSVIIFSESSHWDPNWLLTSEEYYRIRVRRILHRALRELESEPRRVFGVECVFFIKMYWDRTPDKRETVRQLVNQGRIRFTGSGMTTPDTVLPETEALIRDYLLGQEWLRKNGMDQEPRLAYLPDNFGLAPTVPDLLSALGYGMAAFSRIDGSFFPGSDYRFSSHFPRPGTSADVLWRKLKTTDFVWKGLDGSHVLCHWNPFTYGQGDMVASRGVVKWMGLTLGIPDRSTKNVAGKIESYTKPLMPLARTPYLLCPMGFDFNAPVRDLVGLLDRYNRHVYPDSGVFALNAGMDDYLDLVSCHRQRLPELELDMNPYWMGFYSSRPEMKQRCRKIVRDLVRLEGMLALAGQDERAPELLDALTPAWDTAVLANHHDFITGTSPDRVWKKEQSPWLVNARNAIRRVEARATELFASASSSTPSLHPVAWSRNSGVLLVESDQYRMEITEDRGGCIVRWVDPATGYELLSEPGNDPTAYVDSGGLWRMGHEYRGGVFRMRASACQQSAVIRAEERNGVLHVRIDSSLEGRKLVREMWFRSDSSFVRMRIIGSAPKRRTITCRFPTSLGPQEICTEVPGGVAVRPLVKVYDPTFWPALTFAHLRDANTGQGIALFMGGPASVSADAQGVLECTALRNAPKERAFGVLPLLAHPAYGEDNDEHSFDYAAGFTRHGDWRRNRLHVLASEVLADTWIEAGKGRGLETAYDEISTGSDDVRVLAVKPAHRGDGLVVRLQSFGAPAAILELKGRPVKRAVLCDARERDLEGLECRDGKAEVPLKKSINTVRVIF